MKISNNQNHIQQIQTSSSGSKGVEESKKGGKFAFARDLFDKATSMRFGSVAESICDRLGLPEGVGDVAGIFGSLATMNFVELTEHAADLVKDVAAKNGNTKLAGFCEGYEQKVGKFNQIAGKVGFMVGSTLATGGAGAALGASTGAVSAGGLTMSAGQFFQGVSMVGGAIDAGGALERGDKMGAALGALGVLGEFGGMGEVFGLSASQAEGLKTFADEGQFALGWFANAKADGEINLKDLAHVPAGELLDKLGIEGSGLNADQIALLEGSVGVMGSEDRGGALMSLLTSTIMDRAMGAVGEGEDAASEQALQGALQFFGESMSTGQSSPAAMTLLSQLLSQLGHAESSTPAREYQFGHIKV